MNSRDHRHLAKFVVMSIVVSLLMGCSTVPVTPKFPDAPGNVYMEACPDLIKLKDDPVLSDISKTINDNYGSYYECAVKVDIWINWYRQQRAIFESLK